MENQKYWDALFEKINSMSEKEFTDLTHDLDKTSDILFSVCNEELLSLYDYMDGNNDNEEYAVNSQYVRKSKENFNMLYIDSEAA